MKTIDVKLAHERLSELAALAFSQAAALHRAQLVSFYTRFIEQEEAKGRREISRALQPPVQLPRSNSQQQGGS